MIPRIRGKVGQIKSPKELAGKYAFEIIIADLYGKQIGDPIGPFGPYDTEAKAHEELRGACRLAAETYERNETGKVSVEYLDMKNGGIVRQWEEN